MVASTLRSVRGGQQHRSYSGLGSSRRKGACTKGGFLGQDSAVHVGLPSKNSFLQKSKIEKVQKLKKGNFDFSK